MEDEEREAQQYNERVPLSLARRLEEEGGPSPLREEGSGVGHKRLFSSISKQRSALQSERRYNLPLSAA